MRILLSLSLVATVASAADYSVVDPVPAPDYAPEKPQISAPVIALITKLLDAIQGYDSYAPAPALAGDAYVADQTYPDADLLKLLNLLLQSKPEKYAPKATLKLLNRLPGIYGGLPPYGLHPAFLPAAPYKRPPLALLPPYAPHPLNLVYPPGLSAYGLPLHPAHKVAPNPAGAYGYPGYAHPALGLPPLPLIVITKELLDSLKTDGYEPDAAPEAPAPVYAAKPKKAVVKVVAAAKKAPAYAPAKAKVPAAAVKPYAAAVKVKPVLKVVKGYPKAAAVVVPAAVEDPAAAYVAAATDAPADPYPVEARAASGGESQSSPEPAASKASDKKVDPKAQSSSDGGESARASLADHSISSPKTISRIS